MSRSLGWVVLAGMVGLGVAGAARSAPDGAKDLRCRAFSVSVDKEQLIDTSDATSELGRWVASQRGEGWDDPSVDLELATRTSGTLVAFAQVCLRR